jgi:hypothetical protein
MLPPAARERPRGGGARLCSSGCLADEGKVLELADGIGGEEDGIAKFAGEEVNVGLPETGWRGRHSSVSA